MQLQCVKKDGHTYAACVGYHTDVYPRDPLALVSAASSYIDSYKTQKVAV
jgi:hypothetical protein